MVSFLNKVLTKYGSRMWKMSHQIYIKVMERDVTCKLTKLMESFKKLCDEVIRCNTLLPYIQHKTTMNKLTHVTSFEDEFELFFF
jgi:hypothetical protein